MSKSCLSSTEKLKSPETIFLDTREKKKIVFLVELKA